MDNIQDKDFVMKDPQENRGVESSPNPVKPAKAATSSPLLGFKVAAIIALLISLAAFLTILSIQVSIHVDQQEKASLEASNVQLKDQIQVLKEEQQRFNSQISKLREQIENYALENSKIKKELDQAYISIAAFRDEKEVMEEAAEKIKKSNLSLMDQVAAAESAKTKLQNEIEKMRSGSTAASFKSPSSFSSQVNSALPVVAAPQGTATPTVSTLRDSKPDSVEPSFVKAVETPVAVPQDSGEEASESAPPQVMTVNRSFDFVVINIGMVNGLKMGDRLEVLRNNQPIAEIQVEKLYDRFSAATILSEKSGTSIEKGDSINKL